jgi:hypothetical protein
MLYSQAVAERIGIGSADLECLNLIALSGPLPAGAIAEAVGLGFRRRDSQISNSGVPLPREAGEGGARPPPAPDGV